jgi:predicted phage tail protein
MSKAAFSSRVFAIYLLIVGAVLAVVPNVLLSMLQMPQTSEVWIHVIGVLAFNVGIYAWVAAENEHFLKASVYTRFVFFVAVTTFAVTGMASPMIIVFGVTDLLGGIWTHIALKADSQSAQPSLAGQH